MVPQERTRGRVDLLGEEAQAARPSAERLIELDRLIEPALGGQVVDQPEAAQQEGPLVAGEPVLRLLREVAVEEPIASAEAL